MPTWYKRGTSFLMSNIVHNRSKIRALHPIIIGNNLLSLYLKLGAENVIHTSHIELHKLLWIRN